MQKQRKITTDLVLISLFANSFEWYDFFIFGFLSSILGKQFFNASDPFVALLLGFMVFSTAFLSRPFGAIISSYFTHLKDEAFALNLSLWMMAFPAGIMTFLPTYHTIGVAAPLILVTLRLIQGLGSAGETPTAMAYLFRQKFDPHKRPLYNALLLSGSVFTIFLASLFIEGLTLWLGHERMLDFGWRIPFAVSIPLTAITLYMRRTINAYRVPKEKKEKLPVKHMAWKVIHGAIFYTSIPFYFYLLFFWYPALIHVASADFARSLGLGAIVVGTFALGFILLRIPHVKSFHVWTNLVLALITIPLYILIPMSTLWAYVSFAVLGLVFGLVCLTANLMLPVFYPPRGGVLGMSLALAITNAYIAGPAPTYATYLYAQGGFFRLLPAIALTVTAILTAATVYGMRDVYLEKSREKKTRKPFSKGISIEL